MPLRAPRLRHSTTIDNLDLLQLSISFFSISSSHYPICRRLWTQSLLARRRSLERARGPFPPKRLKSGIPPRMNANRRKSVSFYCLCLYRQNIYLSGNYYHCWEAFLQCLQCISAGLIGISLTHAQFCDPAQIKFQV